MVLKTMDFIPLYMLCQNLFYTCNTFGVLETTGLERLSLLKVASDGGFPNLECLLKTSPAAVLFRKVTPAVERTTCLYVCLWRDSPKLSRAFSFTRFLDHTRRRTIVGRTHLDE